MTTPRAPVFPTHLIGQGGTVGEGHPEIDRRSLERAKLIVAKVDANPSLIRIAVENLERWMKRTGDVPNACDVEWMALVTERPWSELRAILLDESDEGQRLRSSHPFIGILTDEERESVQ